MDLANESACPHLYAVARKALVAGTFDEVVHAALSSMGKLLPAWRHSIGLVDEDQCTYTLYAAAGETEVLPAGTTMPLVRFGADLARLRRGEVDLVQDVRVQPGSAASMAGSALRGQLIAPILGEGMLQGTVNIGADAPHYFDDAHMDAAQELAALVGAALRQVGLRKALAEARDAALASSRAKSAFLANMSHELRTPLNIVLGYAELLLEDAEQGLAADLQRIHRAGSHLHRLVADVLDLSRVEAGRLPLSLQTLDLAEVLAELADCMPPLLARGHNRWMCQVERDLPAVRADPTRLHQVLLNLLSNAAKFTDHGVVGIRAWRDGERVAVAVTDTGGGIAADELAAIFEPFTQAHAPAGQSYGGTGLGLTVARALARQMGGELRVESQLGKGSQFVLSLLTAQSCAEREPRRASLHPA